MKRPVLEVSWWDGRVVGRLTAPGPVYFEYDSTWLEEGRNLSPLALPFTPGAQRKSDPFFNGLPGVLADCLPDSWGELVMQRVFEQQNRGRVTPLKALAWIGARGIGALSFRPGFPSDRIPASRMPVHAGLLAREAREVMRGAPAELFPRIAASGGSVGGAQPKALVALEADGSLVYGGAVASLRGATFHIVKFDHSSDGDLARCEHAYALMAAAAGIEVAPTRLLPAGDDEAPHRQHLLVERFDVLPDGKRVHIHTLSGLLEKPARMLDYADFLRAALRLIERPEERESAVRTIVRRMLFNVLAANDDDHGKNHAFMLIEDTREWRVTPAYDLTFVPAEGLQPRGLSIRKQGGVPELRHLTELSRDVGIGNAEFTRMIEEVLAQTARWAHFAQQVGVRDEAAARIERALLRRRDLVTSPSRQ